MTRNRLTLLGIATALVVLLADQASKWWILDGIDLPAIGQLVVLPEVGRQPNHPALCARCADAVESGLVCRA